jgi:hypothetical protein
MIRLKIHKMKERIPTKDEGEGVFLCEVGEKVWGERVKQYIKKDNNDYICTNDA